jgi:hypothetical protein
MRLRAFHEVLGPVSDDEEKVDELAVYIIVNLNRARRLVEQHVGRAPKTST